MKQKRIIDLKLRDGTPTKIDLDSDILDFDGKKFQSGGTARVYKCRIGNRVAILKVIPDFSPGSKNIFSRMGKIYDALKDLDTKEFEPGTISRIEYRGLPIGHAHAKGKDFGYYKAEEVYILLFNLINGVSLKDHLVKESPLSPKRIQATRQLLDMLVAFEKMGLIHSDLFQENFIVNQDDYVFAIDLDSAGIKSKNGNWIFKPATNGRHYLPIPYEFDWDKDGRLIGRPDAGSDIWFGSQLIFLTLTNFHPFVFLRHTDKRALEHLTNIADETKSCWPPILKRPSSFGLLYQNPKYSLDEMKKFMDDHFKSTNLGSLLHETYIVNYKHPEKRPKFSKYKVYLKKFLDNHAGR